MGLKSKRGNPTNEESSPDVVLEEAPVVKKSKKSKKEVVADAEITPEETADDSAVASPAAEEIPLKTSKKGKKDKAAEGEEAKIEVVRPDEKKVKSLLKKTGYSLAVTTAQRRYGGPPPEWDGPETGPLADGYKIRVDFLPKDAFEYTIVPLFEEFGRIWELSLKMDTTTGNSKEYAFITYCDKSSANAAVEKMNGYEIAEGKKLLVALADVRTRLFLGRIPKDLNEKQIMEGLVAVGADGVSSVTVLPVENPSEGQQNGGFCFVDFVDQQKAAYTKWKFENKFKPFKSDVVVDWATKDSTNDQEQAKKETKMMLVRNLNKEISEELLKETFSKFGTIESIKKLDNHAYINFDEVKSCHKAIKKWNEKTLSGVTIQCVPAIRKAIDEVAMSRVKEMLIRPLTAAATAKKLRDVFSTFGKIARVSRHSDHAYIEFKQRSSVLEAIKEWNGKELAGGVVNCMLKIVKPHTKGQLKRKQELKVKSVIDAKKAKRDSNINRFRGNSTRGRGTFREFKGARADNPNFTEIEKDRSAQMGTGAGPFRGGNNSFRGRGGRGGGNFGDRNRSSFSSSNMTELKSSRTTFAEE